MNENLVVTEESIQEQAPTVEAHETSPQTQKSKDQSFRELREAKEKAEQRARDMEQELQTMRYQMKPQGEPQAANPTPDFDIDDDALIEGRHLKRYLKTFQEELKQTKEALSGYGSYTAEQRLRAKYPEIDNIVTQENIKRLSEEKPSLYRSIMASQDLYDKGEAMCDAIRAFIDLKKVDDYSDQDKRLEANKSKPRSSALAGAPSQETPLARYGEYDRRVLSEQDKQRIRDRLDSLRKQG